jgi:type I restriction enzyme S subunit
MRHPAYPEYKDSGMQWLGEVPGHWEVKRGRFAMRVNPPAPILRKLDENQEISFVPMDAVSEYGGIRLDQTRVKAEVGGGYTEFQDGDVVIAKITPCFENGKGSIATGLVNSAAYGTTELHVLRASQALDCRYLFYLTITDGYRKLGESEMYGAGGQKRVPPEFCKNFLTPLPPLPEQTAIADFLDRKTEQIDTLVAKKRRLIALLKEKRTALISRTVTRGLPADAAREFGLEPHTRFKDSGIEWLGQVPEVWEPTPLKFIARIQTGYAFSSDDFTDEGIPVLRIGDITRDGYVDFTNAKYLPETYKIAYSKVLITRGAIVMAMTGATIGKAGKYDLDDPALLNQRVCSFYSTGDNDQSFLWYLLNADFYLEHIKLTAFGGAQPNISDTELLACIVAVAPATEQTAIATYLDRETAKIDKLVEKVEAAIARLQEYRIALITAAVTGKIDVREAVA